MADGIDDAEWRARVDKRLKVGDQRFDALEERAAKMEGALMTNTELTQRAVDVSERTDRKVDEMRLDVQPVTDAMKTMEAGIRTIGRLGDVGAKLGKSIVVAGALWLAVKLAFGGASWSEISAVFMRAIGK